MSAEALNLRTISDALTHHATRCEYPAVEIRMHPFEVDRLGWPEIKGVPIVGDTRLPTGRLRIICASPEHGEPVETTEAVPA